MKFKMYKTSMTILPTSVLDVITEYSLILIEYVAFCYIVFGIITSPLAESKRTDLGGISSVL
jgi:hypothetical protein